MERVERTIQKRLTASLMLFAVSCLALVATCMVLSLAEDVLQHGVGLGASARWVLGARGWVCVVAVVATTAILVGVVRRALLRETNILAATSLAALNLFLVAVLFALLLLGLRPTGSAAWPSMGARPPMRTVSRPDPPVLQPARRIARAEVVLGEPCAGVPVSR